ncbi:hypothetical protein LEN26_006423 [Aphanomyces euteiches]|nr:hypothetical protein AeMF1_012320 [Aphanomyces euteiches]KAH9135394.1 hypothetical protein LEN26_006423 [Aphanomyces euteiches]KAH9194704.1 hypothetical protein AeNC1_003305 [Aphanomyces euteiches]
MSTLYAEAAGVLEGLFRRSGGLKSLTYADKIKSKRACFALVCQTLRFKPLLDQLIAAVPELAKLLKRSKSKQTDNKRPSHQALFYIAIYDLLFGKDKKIQGGGYVKKTVLQHANALKTALVRLKIKQKVKSDEDLLPEENRSAPQLPRYARINTIRAQVDTSDVDAIRISLDLPDTVSIDTHVRDVIVFPPGTELHTHDSVTSGRLILQDKASCFPGYILHGERGADDYGDVIDACAAPGNKTSHVAMLVARKTASPRPIRVFAFDKSATRLDLLKRRMAAAGADKIVEPCLASFLDVDLNDAKYANVTSILLDPSCSGSGMTNRLDHLLEIAAIQQDEIAEHDDQVESNDPHAARLESLADFQLQALLKAFSFPNVRRVSYSTCSIFEKENEEVVVAALQKNSSFQLVKVLPTWPRRGVAIPGLTPDQADCLVRANGLEDGTNGFFVAYFERMDCPSEAIPTASESNGLKRKVSEKTQAQKDRKRKKRKAQQAKRAAAAEETD